MKKTKKTILISVAVIITLIAGNVVYWITSDIQQQCYKKIKSGQELNLYEKSSIYSINLCICAFGWPLSPEATVQQILCTIPTKDTVTLHSRHFSKHDKVKSLVKRYPNATVNKPSDLLGLPIIMSLAYGRPTPFKMHEWPWRAMACISTRRMEIG